MGVPLRVHSPWGLFKEVQMKEFLIAILVNIFAGIILAFILN